MPELPEVETVRRGLEGVLVGQRFARVEVRRPDLRFPFPPHFAKRLEGQSVVALARRAKYLLVQLSSGEVLIVHLGMTGRFTVQPGKRGITRVPGQFEYDGPADAKHDHVVFHMSSGATITYNDARRFGFMLLASETDLETHPLFKGLGVEPFGDNLSPEYLARRAAGRRSDLKSFLMDQHNVAGLGNIYVSEALFRARLKPSGRASVLAGTRGEATAEAKRLAPAIRAVLADAVKAGGSTLRDYRTADGSQGGFQHKFRVYGRTGKPCVRPGCPGIVRRVLQGGRSTFFCPVCQH